MVSHGKWQCFDEELNTMLREVLQTAQSVVIEIRCSTFKGLQFLESERSHMLQRLKRESSQ